MTLNEIIFEIFKNALPLEGGMRNWKLMVLILILYYDVFCNKHDIAYKQINMSIMLDFLYDTIVIWLRYWCWVYKIRDNNNHMITLAYVGTKYIHRIIKESFTNHQTGLNFVSGEFRHF